MDDGDDNDDDNDDNDDICLCFLNYHNSGCGETITDELYHTPMFTFEN